MFKEINSIIEAELMDNWTDTPITWENVSRTPTRGESFIRMQTIHSDGVSAAVGGTRERYTGYYLLSVFVPTDTGPTGAYILADKLAGLIGSRQFGVLTTAPATIDRVGQQEEWFQINVMIPFIYDLCK